MSQHSSTIINKTGNGVFLLTIIIIITIIIVIKFLKTWPVHNKREF